MLLTSPLISPLLWTPSLHSKRLYRRMYLSLSLKNFIEQKNTNSKLLQYQVYKKLWFRRTKVGNFSWLVGWLDGCRYIESKPKYWNPKHSVIVKEIENVDKLKMALCVQHTINHQNYGDRNTRITDLIFELKRIFENLNVKYHLLPQQVHLTQLNIPIS